MEIVHKEFKALNAQFHSGTAQSPHRCIGVQKHQSHITLQMYVMHFVILKTRYVYWNTLTKGCKADLKEASRCSEETLEDVLNIFDLQI